MERRFIMLIRTDKLYKKHNKDEINYIYNVIKRKDGNTFVTIDIILFNKIFKKYLSY